MATISRSPDASTRGETCRASKRLVLLDAIPPMFELTCERDPRGPARQLASFCAMQGNAPTSGNPPRGSDWEIHPVYSIVGKRSDERARQMSRRRTGGSLETTTALNQE